MSTITKHHQTALFLLVADEAKYKTEGAGQARVNRLLESVNDPGMMVDIFTIDNGVIFQQPSGIKSIPVETIDRKSDFIVSTESLVEWAQQLGYVMVLTATVI